MSVKILLITEKCSPDETQRDGGARLVDTMKRAFGDSLSIMQFGPETDSSATWRFDYPFDLTNRFERRLANAHFVAEQVKAVEQSFTHVIFVHVSMQFGLVNLPLREEIHIWTFPMFLTPSYRASGEVVPESYLEMERLTLVSSKNILTPSHLERRQLIEFYSIPEERIHVVPRGVDTRFLVPEVRFLDEPPKFCSVGSIKPQKNILGLIRLFANIRDRFPGATLRIIGPVQNSQYYKDVLTEIRRLGLYEIVELTGHLAPNKLSLATKDAHLHISTSTCETFGRSIFETLASGLPNIARATGNAAAEFLERLPYARFVDDDNEALDVIEEMLANLSKLSSMALEIGRLYDDEMLSRLLVAKICHKDVIAISDFDGTLFHKDDPEKTQRCLKAFQRFPMRVICTARPIHDLLDKLGSYNLEVDWIVGCSGSIVTDGEGKLLWRIPLDLDDVARLEALIPQTRRIEVEGETLQIAAPVELLPNIFGLRVEVYQGIAFISHWEASKFHAVHRLLHHINWSGRVRVFGDGPYDAELLTYFDGILITSSPHDNRQEKEIENV
jgi:glycosyltransferase involved in cell wall biosynthesis